MNAAHAGQLSKARGLMHRAADSAQRADEKETAAGYEADAAGGEALAGNMIQAEQQAQTALARSTARLAEMRGGLPLNSVFLVRGRWRKDLIFPNCWEQTKQSGGWSQHHCIRTTLSVAILNRPIFFLEGIAALYRATS